MPVILDGKTYYTPEEVSAHWNQTIDEQTKILRENLKRKSAQRKAELISA